MSKRNQTNIPGQQILKILNISPLYKHILVGLYLGNYIRRAFYVGIFVPRLVKSITKSMKYWYIWQKLSFFKQKSPLFCLKIYLNPPWYLFLLWLSTYSPVLEIFSTFSQKTFNQSGWNFSWAFIVIMCCWICKMVCMHNYGELVFIISLIYMF